MTYRVLCVDDETLIREALSLFLEHFGLGVRCMESGSGCVQEFRAAHQEYDLVIVNYDMPGMDGVEVIRRLRKIDKQKRLALTTAYPEREVLQALPPGEVVAFLRKPYTLSRLRRFLQQNLPAVEPSVFALEGAGALQPCILEQLREEFALKLRGSTGKVLHEAKRDFAGVVVLEAEDAMGRLGALEPFRAEGIPLIFLGSPADHSLLAARLGPVLSEASERKDLALAIREAARGSHA